MSRRVVTSAGSPFGLPDLLDRAASRIALLERGIITLINVALPRNWADPDDEDGADLEHADAWRAAARLVGVDLPEST
jgi:hypothetical protein